ncbi:uncharacterized [Tachysurus ichikawai]
MVGLSHIITSPSSPSVASAARRSAHRSSSICRTRNGREEEAALLVSPLSSPLSTTHDGGDTLMVPTVAL